MKFHGLSVFVYENNSLQFFGHEEGRVRINSSYALTDPNAFVYDYFIKDHLGNTRMTLTDEQRQDVYPAATLEDGAIGTEQGYYNINNSTGTVVSPPAGVPSYANNNGNPPYNSNPNSNTTAYRILPVTAPFPHPSINNYFILLHLSILAKTKRTVWVIPYWL